jgi:hypothetical protein
MGWNSPLGVGHGSLLNCLTNKQLSFLGCFIDVDQGLAFILRAMAVVTIFPTDHALRSDTGTRELESLWKKAG